MYLASMYMNVNVAVQALQKMGTYAGNDAIVAFARLHKVNIIIHQLNSPFLLVRTNICYHTQQTIIRTNG